MLNLKPLPKEPTKYTNVLSEKVITWHHEKHHAGYVAKYNEIIEKLSKAQKNDANANYSDWGELKRRLSFNHSGIVLHDNYWKVFGSDGSYKEDSVIISKIISDFGSFQNWKDDFIATGKSSLGWVLCVWDSYADRIINVSVDFHNNGSMWDSILLIACDVFEHAYYADYGPDRATYLTKFVDSLDWTEIEANFTGEKSGSCCGDCSSGECSCGDDCKNCK